MVERVCSACQHGNLLDNRFCGHCGAPLERQYSLAMQGSAPQQTTAITIAGHNLPVTWKQVGQTVAISLTAFAAEAGMAWLRRKIEHVAVPQPAAQHAKTTALVPTQTAHRPKATNDVVTIVSQKVVEIWDHGTLTRQVVERTFWRKEE